jgi:hypothetical protein
MKTLYTTKLVSTTLLAGLTILSLGCGYSKNMMPAQPGAMPTVAQLNPAAGTANNSFALEVDGASFANNAVINFNGAPMATTFVNAGKLTTTIPATAVMNAGAVPVTVTNPAVAGGRYGGGTTAMTSTPVNFTVN